MPILYSYPEKTNPSNNDVLFITDVDGGNLTKVVKIENLPGGSAAGVSSLNSLTGGLNITAGSGITVSPSGSNIQISSSGGSGSLTLKNSGTAFAESTTSIDFTTNVTATSSNNGAAVTIAATDTTYSVMGSGNSYAAGLVLAGSATHGSQFLRKDGTWQTAGGSTSPAGNTTEVQYNNAGSFGANSGLTYTSGGSLATLVVGNQGSSAGVISAKGADTTVGRLRLYCPDTSSPHYFELMGPDHTGGTATYSVQVPEASPGGTEKILSVSAWNSGTSKADLAWVNLPTDTNTTSLEVDNSAGSLQFTATNTTGIKFEGGTGIDTTFNAGTYKVTNSLSTGAALTNLGGGSGSTYLKKDGTWGTPSSGTSLPVKDYEGTTNFTSTNSTGILFEGGTGISTTFNAATYKVTNTFNGSLNNLSNVTFAGTSGASMYVGINASGVPASLSGTPVRNVYIGEGAGDLTTSGAYNTFIGNDAGNTITTGNYNVAIGNNAEPRSAGDSSSTSIGASAAASTSGTAIGYEAIVTGVKGIAIGRGATTSAANIALGSSSYAINTVAEVGGLTTHLEVVVNGTTYYIPLYAGA